MPSVVLAKDISGRIEQLLDNLPQALLLVGAHGAGLLTTAKMLAGDKLNSIIEPTDKNGNVDKTSGKIRIEQIRNLTDHAIGKSRIDRIYIIDDADSMQHQAQNAFLKLLEEPLPHVHFILLAHDESALLPTVLSRMQFLRLPSISREQSEQILDNLLVHDATTRAQLLFLAKGLPGELVRLAQNPNDFKTKSEAIALAKLFLQGSQVDKFRVIQQVSVERSLTLQMLIYARMIIEHSLRSKPSDDLVTMLDQIGTAYDRISANGQIKLQLTALVL